MKIVSDEELNIRKIKPILIRNKKIILFLTVIGFLLGLFNAYKSKDKETWKGEFQIVMTGDNPSSSGNLLPKGIIDLIGNKNDQNTDVIILQSPYVLMDIFDFVKSKRISNGDNNFKNYTFKNWREKQIDVERESSSSILNVKYRDSDKSLIMPVLNKISQKYQKYASDKRERSLNLSIKYFEDEINTFKEKSQNSMNEAQTFALRYNISAQIGNNSYDLQNSILNKGRTTNATLDGVMPVINVEKIRIDAIQEISFIDEKLKIIKKINEKKDYDQFLYMVSSSNNRQGDLLELLKKLDLKISNARMFYKESDKTIKNLLLDREDKLKLLSKNIKQELFTNKMLAQSRLEASKRPEEVLIKYRELIKNAYKDSFALEQLENSYRFIMLEKSKNPDPWQLITQPTLFESPLKPNLIQIIIFHTIAGLMIGLTFTGILEIKRNNVFSSEEIEKITGLPLIANIFLNENKSFKDSLNLLKQIPVFGKFEKLSILETGFIEKNLVIKLKDKLKEQFNKEILFTDNIEEAFKNENIILLTSEGNVTSKELSEINQKIITYNKKGLGFILLSIC
tara:strand:+ start:704 stop:2407 length:1704 start_codon:yes stop_codon:yes gene_type:complete